MINKLKTEIFWQKSCRFKKERDGSFFMNSTVIKKSFLLFGMLGYNPSLSFAIVPSEKIVITSYVLTEEFDRVEVNSGVWEFWENARQHPTLDGFLQSKIMQKVLNSNIMQTIVDSEIVKNMLENAFNKKINQFNCDGQVVISWANDNQHEELTIIADDNIIELAKPIYKDNTLLFGLKEYNEFVYKPHLKYWLKLKKDRLDKITISCTSIHCTNFVRRIINDINEINWENPRQM